MLVLNDKNATSLLALPTCLLSTKKLLASICRLVDSLLHKLLVGLVGPFLITSHPKHFYLHQNDEITPAQLTPNTLGISDTCHILICCGEGKF